MPSGGFDNLSALPLRRQARERTVAASLLRTCCAQETIIGRTSPSFGYSGRK